MIIAVVGWHGSTHTRRWARFFASRGHAVTVITCGDGDAVDIDALGFTIDNPYEVTDLGAPRGGKIGYVLKAPRARTVIREMGCDLVHCHTATSYGMLGAASGVHPLAVTTHGSDILTAPRNPLIRAIVRWVLRNPEIITVPGAHMKVPALELCGKGVEVFVFQYGVETEMLRHLGSKLRGERNDSEPLRLVTARPLTALYNTDQVIRAAALLDFEWALDIAGDGPERRRLEQLVGRLGVTHRVSFHGRLPEQDAHRLIGSSDIYLSMASSDGVSIALLEAMALGVLPALNDIPANRLWVDDGVNGVLSSAAPEAIAAALRRAHKLNSRTVRRINGDLVRAQGDRETNLVAFEQRLLELTTVRSG